jgi:hypothetical protein
MRIKTLALATALIPALVLVSTSAHAQGCFNCNEYEFLQQQNQQWEAFRQQEAEQQQLLQQQQVQQQLRQLCQQNNILLSQQGYSPAPCN